MATKKKLFQYEEADMVAAVAAVRSGTSKKAAAKQFNVPRSSLVRRVLGRVPQERRMGPSTVLTPAEEVKLEEWLLTIARKGYPIHRNILLDTVKKCLDEQKRETIFKDNRPGLTWWEAFKRRHPRISEKEAESLTKARASVTEQSIRNWFGEVKEWLSKENYFDVLKKPARVFNADETGFMLCPKTGKVIGEKGSKTDFYRVTSNNEKEQLTVMAAFSADGTVVPPMVVYPYKRLPREVGLGVPKTWAIGTSPNGWMNSEVFFEWLANHFIPFVEREKTEFPVVLFVDGHRSHLTMHASELCDAKGVILVALHPNCTHILQPADVAVFRPLKAGWKEHVREWKYANFPNDVTRITFAPLLKQVFDCRAKPLVIQHGFTACGLYPFSADAVDYTKCLKSRIVTVQQPGPNPNGPANDEQPPPIVNLQYLNFFESRINQLTLVQFKESADTWKGDEKSHDLFYFWKSLCAEFNPEMATTSVPVGYPSSSQENQSLSHAESGEVLLTSPCPENVLPEESSKTPIQPTPGPSSSTFYGSNSSSLLKYRCNEVASPFKNYLLYPRTPEKDPNKKNARKKLRFPSVVSSTEYRDFIIKKEEAEKNKSKRKRNNEKECDTEKNGEEENMESKGKRLLKRKGKKEDWKCNKCKNSWNKEVQSGIPSKWIECENCKSWFHVKCISKKHCNDFGFLHLLNSDDSESEDEINFICQRCAHLDSDIDGAFFTSTDNEEF